MRERGGGGVVRGGWAMEGEKAVFVTARDKQAHYGGGRNKEI